MRNINWRKILLGHLFQDQCKIMWQVKELIFNSMSKRQAEEKKTSKKKRKKVKKTQRNVKKIMKNWRPSHRWSWMLVGQPTGDSGVSCARVASPVALHCLCYLCSTWIPDVSGYRKWLLPQHECWSWCIWVNFLCLLNLVNLRGKMQRSDWMKGLAGRVPWNERMRGNWIWVSRPAGWSATVLKCARICFVMREEGDYPDAW